MSGKAATAEANAGEVVSNLNKIIDSGRNMDGVGLGQGISGAYEAASNIKPKDILASLVQNLQDAVFAQS